MTITKLTEPFRNLSRKVSRNELRDELKKEFENLNGKEVELIGAFTGIMLNTYEGKTTVVIRQKDENGWGLDTAYCRFKNVAEFNEMNEGEKVSVKGIFSYDDSEEDGISVDSKYGIISMYVKLNNCQLIK